MWYTSIDTVRGMMSRLLGNAMSALVQAAALVQQQPVVVCEFCNTVSCGRVMSKDVLYSDDTMYF